MAEESIDEMAKFVAKDRYKVVASADSQQDLIKDLIKRLGKSTAHLAIKEGKINLYRRYGIPNRLP